MNWTYVGKLVGGGVAALLIGSAASYQVNPVAPLKIHGSAGLVAMAGYVTGLYTKRPQD